MAEIHYFDVKIAEKYGVNCAILLQHIWHCVRKNEANEKNFYDGNYWTYNSARAFSEMFPHKIGIDLDGRKTVRDKSDREGRYK